MGIPQGFPYASCNQNDDAMGIPQGVPYASCNENDDAMGIPQGIVYASCNENDDAMGIPQVFLMQAVTQGIPLDEITFLCYTLYIVTWENPSGMLALPTLTGIPPSCSWCRLSLGKFSIYHKGK